MLELADFRDKIIGEKAYVWLFNIGAEKVWFSLPKTVGKESNDFFMGVEYMNLLLCQEQDYVIFRRPPNWKFLNYLRRQGICIPNIIWINNPEDDMTISECILHDSQILEILTGLSETHILMPYAVTLFIEEIAVKTGISIVGAEEKVAKRINNKVFARLLSQELGYVVCEGNVFQNATEAFEYYKSYLLSQKVILLCPYSGFTNLYIYEGFKFKIVDKFITNFHAPNSTRIALAAAFTGKDLLIKGYKAAKENSYMFFEFGDATLTI